MYIELFLLDNLVMNCLIVKLAASLLCVSPSKLRVLLLCQLSAAIGAAVIVFPAFNTLLSKAITLLLLTAAIKEPNSAKLFTRLLVVLLSSAIVGGFSFAIAFVCGGSFTNGVLTVNSPMRVLLWFAIVAALMPRLLRSLLQRSVSLQSKIDLTVTHNGVCIKAKGLLDSGNLLFEPVSMRPVIVINAPELCVYAKIPIEATSAFGKEGLKVFSPDRLLLNGVSCDAMIAPVDTPTLKRALVPLRALTPAAMAAPDSKA